MAFTVEGKDGTKFTADTIEELKQLVELSASTEETSETSEEESPLLTSEQLKEGDTVRVISADDGTDSPYHGFTIGSTVEVEEVHGNGRIEAYDGVFYQTLLPHHFEKEVVEEKTFKVGDKVRVTGNSSGHTEEVGEVRRITEVDSFEPKYNLSRRLFGNWANTKDLELVAESEAFENGDLVKVTESFEDEHGDKISRGTICEYEDWGGGLIFLGSVVLGDNYDKIKLVCREEDRKDISL